MMRLFLVIFFTTIALSAQDNKEQLLNARLTQLLPLEDKGVSTDLFIDIAQTFYQLKQYPWALLYSERALKNQPGNSLAKQLKNQSLERLFLKQQRGPFISLNTSLWLFFAFFFIAFLLASFAFWKRRFGLIMGGFCCLILSFLFLAFSLKLQYFSPLPAIVVNPTALYRGEGFEFPVVFDKPIVAGTKIGVINDSDSGEWLKVQTANGIIGYIPIKSIRII